MPAWVIWMLSDTGRKVVVTTAAVALCAAIYWRGFDDARDAAELRDVKQQLEQRETRDAVEDGIRRGPDPVGRLLDGWARD